MIHRLLAAALLGSVVVSSAAVRADDDAPRCEVRVKRAPAMVREAIERRLAREAACRPLTVRVIADEGRLFVLAHDVWGQVYESELVDVASAAEVVASWATRSDDAPRCSVEVRRAPDPVRVAIEQWLAPEQACGLPLIVRVIADEGRMFVLAHDERGRIFERAVPDAESVAALVASWATL